MSRKVRSSQFCCFFPVLIRLVVYCVSCNMETCSTLERRCKGSDPCLGVEVLVASSASRHRFELCTLIRVLGGWLLVIRGGSPCLRLGRTRVDAVVDSNGGCLEWWLDLCRRSTLERRCKGTDPYLGVEVFVAPLASCHGSGCLEWLPRLVALK